MFKKLALGVGILFGVAHIGLLGHLMNRPTATQIPLPETGDYSSYRITAGPDGSYTIEYIGNDPRVLTEETNSQRNGFFGGNRTTTHRTEYTQDGAKNQGKPGSLVNVGPDRDSLQSTLILTVFFSIHEIPSAGHS